MNKSMRRIAVLSLAAVLLAAAAVAAAPEGGNGGETVRVLVTNDVHGNIFGEAGRERIGYALFAGYADGPGRVARTFLFDAGDAFSGSALAQFDSGRTVAELMGAMGYRVLSPGNHAFDFNAPEGNPLYYPETLVGTVAASSPGQVRALCLNLTWRGGPVPGIGGAPAVVYEGDGLRLVVIGVITPYAATKTNRLGVEGFGFGLVETASGRPDHAATRDRLLEMLEQALTPYDRPGDVVVVLSHVGWDLSADYADGQVSGKDLAAVRNVDVLVDSHSHFLVPPERIGGAWYGQAGRYLEHFAEITLSRRDGGDWSADLAIRDYADVRDAAPSQAILERLRAASDRMGLGEELFRIDVADGLFTDVGINSANLPLGRLLCRSILEITRADLALYNSGGIRSGLPAGWVTAGAVYDMIPFQNNLVTFSMTGAEILDLFNRLPPRGSNGFPQFHGMTAYAVGEEGESLRTVGLLDAEGEELSPTKRYVVAVNSFMASGGDGFSFDSDRQTRDFGDAATALVNHFRSKAPDRLADLQAARPLRLFPTPAAAEAAFFGGRPVE